MIEILDYENTKKNKTRFRLAFIGERSSAFLIDSLFVIAISFICVAFLYGDRSTIFIICCSLLFYKPIAEAFWGTTLGKRIFRIEVVNVNYAKLGFGRALIRSIPFNLVLILLMINLYDNQFELDVNTRVYKAFFFLVVVTLFASAIFSFTTKKKQAGHDLVSGSIVIEKM